MLRAAEERMALMDKWKRAEQALRAVALAPSETKAAFEDLRLLAAEPALARIRELPRLLRLRDAELRVFSQFGDDGIIHRLIHSLPLCNDTFVEFGVSDYRESNTRLLLLRDNWRGVVLDGDAENVASIRADRSYWRHELIALCAFIDRDNIGGLLRSAGIDGSIGLLHIDLDGNDYWIWDRLDVDADIVIVEYNAVFGAVAAVSVPYDPGFRRQQAHPSWLYWGASLGAQAHLAARKGYVFIGCNSAGNNAYFVKRALAVDLPQPTIAAGFVQSRYRESRGDDGALTWLTGTERRAAIANCEVVDVVTGARVRVGALP